MKNNVKPAQNDIFQLQEVDGEYMLFKPEDSTAIFINEISAIIWQLCDSKNSVKEIKEYLQQAYPESAKAIPKDVDDVLELLGKHNALIA